MKKLMTKLAVIILAITLSVGFAGGENDFNWAQWYQWNGMGSVAGMVSDGSMTAQEACETIIIPANNAGFVEEKHAIAFAERYPEIKPLLITLPQQNPPLPYPNIQSKNAICISTQQQTLISVQNLVPMQEKLVTYLRMNRFM